MGRLIIELLPAHGQGVDKRYVFEEGKASIGRSYSNDIILDDPFVSPHHLSVSQNGTGICVKDLASENGTQVNGETTPQGQATKIASGDEVCIGKTRLKIVLPDHPVEPARRMDSFLVMRRFLDKRSVAVVYTLVVLGLSVWMSYLGEPSERFWKASGFQFVLGFLVSTALYVGIVGLICHIKLRKAYFNRHLAVCNTFSLIWQFYEMWDPFLFFWISSYSFLILAKYTIHFGFLLMMFLFSVKLTNNLVRWTDTAKLSVVSLVFVLMTGWGAKEIQLGFSGDPVYPSHLAPYLKPLSEPETFEKFLEKPDLKLYNTLGKIASR